MNEIHRRQLLRGLFGGFGLAALSTGLSPRFLRAPLAWAGEDACATNPRQFLLLSVSDRGDAVNCNCPGTYDDNGVIHPSGADFAKTSLKLGTTSTSAAALWAQLPQWALDRASFIHHATRSVVHSEMPKILRLQGATAYDEMLPTLISQKQAPCLHTLQDLPVNVGKYVQLTAGGLALPRMQPTALKQLLASSTSPLAGLRTRRDRHLDEIHAILKRDGTSEQRAYLDARAASREDARKLADDAASLFTAISDDSARSEILAAVALFRLNVTPVVTVSLPFGGDNHSDPSLQEEADQHVEGIEALVAALEAIDAAGMLDRITFAMLNVFGRNLAKEGVNGRDHWAEHAVSLLIGPRVKACVVGAITPHNGDYRCLDIDSTTGKGVDGGDIARTQSLESVGKTIWAAVGGETETIESAIARGSIIRGALA